MLNEVDSGGGKGRVTPSLWQLTVSLLGSGVVWCGWSVGVCTTISAVGLVGWWGAGISVVFGETGVVAKGEAGKVEMSFRLRDLGSSDTMLSRLGCRERKGRETESEDEE